MMRLVGRSGQDVLEGEFMDELAYRERVLVGLIMKANLRKKQRLDKEKNLHSVVQLLDKLRIKKMTIS